MIARFSVFMFILIIGACGEVETSISSPDASDIEEARAAAKQLGTELKGELMAAMTEGGPSMAIKVCAEEAPQIANRISRVTGYTVGRSALRVRNKANTPEDWQRAQLVSFAQQVAEGRDPSSLEAASLYIEDEKVEFRWSKPIVLEGPCTMCHGKNVSPEIKSLIAEHYPEDEATGFVVGELRGMFTVTKSIN